MGALTASQDGGVSPGVGLFLGAVAGASLGKIAFKAALPRGSRQALIQRMHASPGVTAALKRTHPLYRKAFSSGMRELADGISDTFVPYGEMKRTFEQLEARGVPGAASVPNQAIATLDRFAGRLFELPGEVAQQLHHIIDPLKDADDYTQLFQILRLRRDIEERLIDQTRRSQAFLVLQQYRAAKRAGNAAVAAGYRQILQRNRQYLKPLDPFIRKGMDLPAAQQTLAALTADAARSRPQVLEAANRYKATMTAIGQELQAEGLLDPRTLAANQEYFPDYVLSYLAGRLNVGGTRGLHPKRVGFTKSRGPRSSALEIWNDLIGPVAKRVLDQKVMLERARAAQEILDVYDPVVTGRVVFRPDERITAREVTARANDGLTYAFWSFRDPTNPNSPSKEGFIPLPLQEELVRRYAADSAFAQRLKSVNSYVKGFLVRGGAGGFLAQNLAGDISNLYAGTPWDQWHRLPLAQVRGLVASIVAERFADPATAPTHLQASRQLAERGAKSGLGTAAAAAEVTETATQSPRFRELAADPNRSLLGRASHALYEEAEGLKSAFDTTRTVLENTNRLAGFIERTGRGIPDEEAGRVVKNLIGNYDPNFFTLSEQGVAMRGFLVPFWAFYKNNFRNWIPGIAKEIAGPGGAMTASRGQAARVIAAKWAKLSMFSLAALAWNHMLFPQAESTLSPWQKDQFHVLVPDPTEPWDDDRAMWNLVYVSLQPLGVGGVVKGARDIYDRTFGDGTTRELAYVGFPTPANMAARAVGLGGMPNRLVHATRGTGSQSYEEELSHSMEQAKDFWGSLLNPTIGLAYTAATGKDWLSGANVARPGQNVVERAAEHVHHAVTSLPVARQMSRAAREGASPDESVKAFLTRMAVGSLVQPIDVDANTAKAVRRAVAEGRRVGEEKSQKQLAKRMKGETSPSGDFTPEEIFGMMGSRDPAGPRAQWQALASDLLKLQGRATAQLPPDAPGAVERAQGPMAVLTPSREGPTPIPTLARLTTLGPDAALKEFFSTLNQRGGDVNWDRWRSAFADLADQLKEQDARWDVPSAIMRILLQEPAGLQDVEILKRLQGLSGAKARQSPNPFQ